MRLFIAGYHRSMTSMVAGYLQKCGLDVGQDLLPPSFSNPRGHFEDIDFVKFHDRKLAANNTNWFFRENPLMTFSNHDLLEGKSLISSRDARLNQWGVKDPRICLFLNFWNNVADGTKFLFVLRNPAASIKSLRKRHEKNIMDKSLPQNQRSMELGIIRDTNQIAKSWISYTKNIQNFAKMRPSNCLIFNADNLTNQNELPLKLKNLWQFDLKEISIEEVYEQKLLTKYDANQPLPIDTAEWALCQSIYSELNSMSMNPHADIEAFRLPTITVVAKVVNETNFNRRNSIFSFEEDEIRRLYRGLSKKYPVLRNFKRPLKWLWNLFR